MYAIIKRILDVLLSLLGLAVLAVPMLALYALIRAGSPGGGFFIQPRAGKDGRLFNLIKFRTMRADHVHDPDPSVVIDDRHAGVTGLGRWLRRTRIDELPQLLNVLAGQMSLVGPRPTVPEQAAAYDDVQRRRLAAPPGITGLAQIHGGTALTWPERIEWDVYYVAHRSLGLDLRILFSTFVRIFRGTDGVPVRLKDWQEHRDGQHSPDKS